ncbi:hypothetical protein [Dyella japonica]|uniref:Uncharacterized protein n=1 Tax=Dyella japonica TaxID=231455 RepID=A0ABV2JPA6_9GAMM
MPRRRTRLNWLYDNDLQQFTTPAGQVVTLLQIAQLLQDQVTCSHDFAGAWTGWRIRQNRLIAPGESFKTSRITASNIRAFSRWLQSFEGEQAQLEFRTEQPGRPANIRAPNANASDDTPCLSSTERRPRNSLATGKAEQEQPSTYEPRRRAEVIQLAEYRKRAR